MDEGPLLEMILLAKKRRSERIVCKYFGWRVFRRGNIYWADGRSNKMDAGRHSLSTADYDEAISRLHELDMVRAVDLKKADASILKDVSEDEVSLDAGLGMYLKHVARPALMKGTKPGTQQRYRSIFDKVVPFLKREGLRTWNQVKRRHLESYAAWLDGEQYAYATVHNELTTTKQLLNYLLKEGILPMECRFDLPMDKPSGTDTYCYRDEEVAAIVEHCRNDPKLDWLGDVIVGLATTGMRISELASRRWSDINLEFNVISLEDESTLKRVRRGKARTTKTGHSRTFPINRELRSVLVKLNERLQTGRVFLAAQGGIQRPDNVRHLLIKHVIEPLADRFPSEEDIPGFEDGRLHSFRHFFCSVCANQGTPQLVLMRWLGHRSSDMVRHYYSLRDEVSQRQMATLKFFGGPDAS